MVPPTHSHTDITVNKPGQQHPPLFAVVLRVLLRETAGTGGPPGRWQSGMRRMVQSNDRALVIKPARPRPGTAPVYKSAIEKRQREANFSLCTFFKNEMCPRVLYTLLLSWSPSISNLETSLLGFSSSCCVFQISNACLCFTFTY